METLVSFINGYNEYAKEYDLSLVNIHNVSESNNVYDQLEIQFPTIRKYIKDNLYKIYYGGKQYLLCHEYKCPVCNSSFCHNNSATIENDVLIHSTCKSKQIKNRINAIMISCFEENNLCSICSETCLVNEHVIMDENVFYHKKCCVNKIISMYNEDLCFVCNDYIYKNGLVITFCEKDGKKVHSSCMVKGVKCKKVTINLKLSRCGLCQFFINDKRCMHKKCENLLKTLQHK